MRISEDGVALATGVGLLLGSLILYVLLPMFGIDGQGAQDVLSQLTAKMGKWQHDPRAAFGSLQGLLWWLLGGIGLGGLLALATTRLGVGMASFLRGYPVVFAIATAACVLAAQNDFKAAGLGDALWAITLGMFISNVFTLPDWIKPALRHELFVKVGLILLGVEVLFGKILAIGLPGLFVAWVVTPIVLVCTFWFGQRVLKMSSKTLNITVSADMSVCGVSAAIATAAACRAKKEELTTAIGLSMLFTSIMMVAMPALIRFLGMPEVLGGAWIGGTIDATGAVVAAGAFLGETAMNVAATIKMIQNILIGVIAFAVAVYWTTKVETGSERNVGIGEIWKRFPKFILGFIGASLLFSLLQQVLEPQQAADWIEDDLIGFTKSLRGHLFCLAFVSIGLSTRFKDLREQFSGGKPLILYVVGQGFNLALTLLMAWIMFYLVFPDITSSL